MKNDRGFRIPEPRDRYIRWPERGAEESVIAAYRKSSAAWAVIGVERVYGSALELVQRYGNDWYPVVVQRVPEADA